MSLRHINFMAANCFFKTPFHFSNSIFSFFLNTVIPHKTGRILPLLGYTVSIKCSENRSKSCSETFLVLLSILTYGRTDEKLRGNSCFYSINDTTLKVCQARHKKNSVCQRAYNGGVFWSVVGRENQTTPLCQFVTHILKKHE